MICIKRIGEIPLSFTKEAVPGYLQAAAHPKCRLKLYPDVSIAGLYIHARINIRNA